MNRYLCLLIIMMFVSGEKVMNAEERMKMPLIIAHRGASVSAPENTLASIKAAVQARADWVEWDTHVTSDGHLLLQHDGSLTRFIGENIAISSISLEESKAYDVGSWFDEKYGLRNGIKFAGEKMPSLQQAIKESLPHVTPLIERKTGSAQQHLAVIREMEAVDKVIVQAFDWEFLKDLRKLAPKLKLGALGSKPIKEKQFVEIFEIKPGYVGWGSKYLKRSDIERFQAEGIKVAVWTVDKPKEIRKFVSWGIDAIITNDPDRTRKVVEAMDK